MVAFAGGGSWGILIHPEHILAKRHLPVVMKTLMKSGVQDMTELSWWELSLGAGSQMLAAVWCACPSTNQWFG